MSGGSPSVVSPAAFAPASAVSAPFALAPPAIAAPGYAALGEVSAEPVVHVDPTMISVAPWSRMEDGEVFARTRYVEARCLLAEAKRALVSPIAHAPAQGPAQIGART